MFKIAKEPTFTHEVVTRAPVDGGFEEQKFKATFRAIDPEEAETFDIVTLEGSTAFLRRVVVQLHDVVDAEGKPVEWNDAVLLAALRLPWARTALARAYFAAIAGAKAGN